MTTIGGVAFRYLDCLPHVGDQVTVEGIQITVMEMDMHRIARVRVARRIRAEEDSERQEIEGEQSSDATPSPEGDGEVDSPADTDVGTDGSADHDTESADSKHAESHRER